MEAHKLAELPITIIDVFDEYALSSDTREELYKCYPHAKLAHLKTGGNFPYLSRSGEVNLHLQVSTHTVIKNVSRPTINYEMGWLTATCTCLKSK